MTLTPATVRLDACTQSHLPAIQEILTYYVHNTVITLALLPPSLDEVRASWLKSTTQGLPYIVALDEHNIVLGFCYAGEFRGGGGRGGYRHTVEFSLFCHPDHMKKGIGAQLLQKLVDILKSPSQFPDYVSVIRKEDEQVRVLLSCMSVDETTWKNGLGLRDFYIKHGFEQVGHMKKVGHKFDRWYATLCEARSLVLVLSHAYSWSTGLILSTCSFRSGNCRLVVICCGPKYHLLRKLTAALVIVLLNPCRFSPWNTADWPFLRRLAVASLLEIQIPHLLPNIINM